VRGTPERLPLVGLGFGAKQENRRADSGLPEGIGPDPTCAKFFNDRVGEAAESVGLCLKVLPLLVDVSNDYVSPVDIGTNAASQLHIIEMDNGHSTLAFKRRKAFRGPVYDHLGCDGRYVQKSTGCLGSFGLSRSSHISDNKGKLASQVTKSSIASSVLILERPSPSLNGEATRCHSAARANLMSRKEPLASSRYRQRHFESDLLKA
jgi:hypothetical protein